MGRSGGGGSGVGGLVGIGVGWYRGWTWGCELEMNVLLYVAL